MNVLFLTIAHYAGIESRGIYTDLLREFKKKGHTVYSVSAYEKRVGKETTLIDEGGSYSLHVKIGNITKCGLIEKGISTLLVESQYLAAIKKYFSGVKFDLVLYSTPPVTLGGVINYIKKRDGAKTYLLLKDIFPQNAVDLGMMRKTGIKSVLYHFFRAKERKLYAASDYIGCMSPANLEFVLKHNPKVAPDKIEVCPNSIELVDKSVDEATRVAIRKKYGIPADKTVFVYGGNLGKPQGIPHLINCLKREAENEDVLFLIVGDGTEYNLLDGYVKECEPKNVILMKRLPKEDYDTLVGACDVGMLFLDKRFTIPNFPSRLLSYMQAKLPVLSITDANTDVGRICEAGGFGTWRVADDVEKFSEAVGEMMKMDLAAMGELGYKYLSENYTVEKSYEIIMARIEEKEPLTL